MVVFEYLMKGPGREPDVSDVEILEVFSDSSERVLSTSEVADAIGLSQRGTFKRLTDLERKGEIRSKEIGGSKAWWMQKF